MKEEISSTSDSTENKSLLANVKCVQTWRWLILSHKHAQQALLMRAQHAQLVAFVLDLAAAVFASFAASASGSTVAARDFQRCTSLNWHGSCSSA